MHKIISMVINLGRTHATRIVHIGPGDSGEPVITIMQPHED